MEQDNNYSDRQSFLEELIRQEELTGVALGIAKQAIKKVLTAFQKINPLSFKML